MSRLVKRLKFLGISSFYGYYHRVKSDNDEMVEMLNCIATNTTKFFRENHHFEYFKNNIMPDLLRNKSDKVIRIWSAGCSSGEEPYSIAMAVHEVLRQLSGGRAHWPSASGYCSDWDIRILATDISTKVLATAQAGVYEEEQLPDDMDEDVVRRYFLRGVNESTGKIKVKDFIKGMIRFRRLNLKDDKYSIKKLLDAIFCRNVMIYFDEHMKRHVLSKFHSHLHDNGHLFLGHSETMHGMEHFTPVHITVYRKK